MSTNRILFFIGVGHLPLIMTFWGMFYRVPVLKDPLPLTTKGSHTKFTFVRTPMQYLGNIDKNYKVYTDHQLENLLEHALKHTDMNKDGYIDYLEYKVSGFRAKKANEAKKSV